MSEHFLIVGTAAVSSLAFAESLVYVGDAAAEETPSGVERVEAATLVVSVWHPLVVGKDTGWQRLCPVCHVLYLYCFHSFFRRTTV